MMSCRISDNIYINFMYVCKTIAIYFIGATNFLLVLFCIITFFYAKKSRVKTVKNVYLSYFSTISHEKSSRFIKSINILLSVTPLFVCTDPKTFTYLQLYTLKMLQTKFVRYKQSANNKKNGI